MTERVVKVSLVAQVSNYVAGMEQARKKTQETGTEAEKAKAKFEAQNKAMTEIGVGLVAFGALAAAGVALAVKKFADFDQAMSQVQAATHETADNMTLLRDAALDAGARTVFSATEAANAIEELGKAGLTTSEILSGGLQGALDLAAAGGLEVADAAGIAAIAMKQFSLSGSDLPHVADLLSAGAGKAVGDVSDLAAALGQAGLVANGAGQSIEDTTGVLAAFADQGLLGSDAGTSLKSAIIALQAPTDKSRAIMEQYGLSFYDTNGRMLSFDKIAGQLKTQLSGLSDEQRNAALAQIFGNDALRSANVLYGQGEKGIRKYIDQTDDAGYAAETAAMRLDNLKGDVEQLGGAFDTALIKTGSAANDSLRAIVQTVTDMVTAFGNAPAPLQAAGLGVLAVGAAVGLLGGGLLLAVPKIAAFNTSMLTLKETAPAVATGLRVAAIAMAGVTVALGVATLIIGKYMQDQAEAKSRVDAFTESLDANSGAVTDNTRLTAAANLQNSGALDLARKLKVSVKDVTDASLGNKDALARVNKELEQYSGKGELTKGIVDRLRDAIGQNAGELEQSKTAWKNQKDATDKGAESTYDAADAYLAASDSASGLTDEVKALTDEVNKANGVGQDAVTANINYQDALQKVRDQVDAVRAGTEGYAAGLDVATQAGRDNYALLIDQAKAGQEAADAQFALDGNTQNYVAALQANRESVLQNARDLGATDDQLGYISDSIVNMPNQKQVDIIANTNEAQRKIREVIDLLNSVPASRQTSVGVTVSNGAFGDAAVKRAAGGAIYGPGTGKSDSVAAYLSTGEHVLTVEDVDAMGGQAGVYQFRRTLHGARGYASGGTVQPQYATGGSYSPTVNVAAPDLSGMRITGSLDLGNGLVGVIDGRIADADSQRSQIQTIGRRARG